MTQTEHVLQPLCALGWPYFYGKWCSLQKWWTFPHLHQCALEHYTVMAEAGQACALRNSQHRWFRPLDASGPPIPSVAPVGGPASLRDTAPPHPHYSNLDPVTLASPGSLSETRVSGPTQACGVTICSLTRAPGDSYAQWSLRTVGRTLTISDLRKVCRLLRVL